ncbi:MAG: hypothetical protein ACXAAO_09065 [Candidatus Thorarchaeota archaeon]|jgi:uncharacterized membrane protein
MGARRFAAPAGFFLLGFLVASQLILMITTNMDPLGWFDWDATLALGPTSLGLDIIFIILIAIPILFLEYYIFAVPIAALILLMTKAVKSKRYELNIMNISSNFGGTQMVRRAAIPALFSVALSSMFRAPLQAWVFGTYEPTGEIAAFFPVVVSLMTALLFMPIALLLFMPTWVLNDAGVVTHLKSDNLELRQCPDTQGVGRWISNMLGGYAILAFPITMFLAHFYEPLIVPLISGGFDLSIAADANAFVFEAIVGFLWTLGLPFFVMAFIIPVIAFNEGMQSRSTIRILKLARRLGAKIVRRERIQEIKRPSTVATAEESANIELWAKATMPASKATSVKLSKDEKKDKSKVVTSRKNTKKNQQKKKKK